MDAEYRALYGLMRAVQQMPSPIDPPHDGPAWMRVMDALHEAERATQGEGRPRPTSGRAHPHEHWDSCGCGRMP